MREHKPAVPAIVVGRDQTGIGTLRSLHAAGIETFVACPVGDPVSRSRYFRPTPGTPWDGDIDANTLQVLATMPIDHAVLVPGMDNAALWLAGLADSALASRFKTSCSSRRTLEILQDKQKFGAFLASSGIAHPHTFTIDGEADIDAIPFAQLDRVFLKPADSQRFARTLGVKGVWANGRDEFERAWRALDAQGFKVIAQEYVPGGADDHYFIDGFRDRHGNLPGLLARRRLRIYPPDFGNSSYCESVALDEVEGALANLEVLLAALEYRGIFSAEFKRDARDGQFRILEVNTRAWWYVEFAARCGVNVCRMAWEDAQDLPVTPASRDYRKGVGCINLPADIRSLAAQPGSIGKWTRACRQWLGGYLHIFRWADPHPGLAEAWTIMRHMLGKRRTRSA